MEIGSGNGDPLQGDSAGVHGWGETGKDCGMCSTRPLCQPLPHQCLRPGTRSLPRQLYNQPRFVSFKRSFNSFLNASEVNCISTCIYVVTLIET